MANTNRTKRNSLPSSGDSPISFAHSIFRARCNQFRKTDPAMAEFYEGLDFDAERCKRRQSAALSLLEEAKHRFGALCPEDPSCFSFDEDWISINAYPLSAYDYFEKHVCFGLGIALWILDRIRDAGKTDQLSRYLGNAPSAQHPNLPPVWDPCHSRPLIASVLWVIYNRNADCPINQKYRQKNPHGTVRYFMDKAAVENAITGDAPSRQCLEGLLSLIEPDALDQAREYYQELYWDWLRRYYLCRNILLVEERALRQEIQHFQNTFLIPKAPTPMLLAKAPVSLLPGSSATGEYYFHKKSLEHRQDFLFRKQEAFNAKAESFLRDIGDFSILSPEIVIRKYGQEIADIWSDFVIEDPYRLCMGFLLMLDSGSELPWCYFPGVNILCAAITALPWTRTKYSVSCDEIWNHLDPETGAVLPGPSKASLPKKIRIPDKDNWYRMLYTDTTEPNPEKQERFNLSQILYEITGCIMPRNLSRYRGGLKTLSQYGINSKKENHWLLYCMSLLGEAKHQSTADTFTPGVTIPLLQAAEEKDQMDPANLRAQLDYYRQALGKTRRELDCAKEQLRVSEKNVLDRKQEVQDMARLLFQKAEPADIKNIRFPYSVIRNTIVFGGNAQWIREMKQKLPDSVYCEISSRSSLEALRKTAVVWVQCQGTAFHEYNHFVNEARNLGISVHYFTQADPTACALQLAKADFSGE